MKRKMIFSMMIVMMVVVAGMPLMASGAQENVNNSARPYEELEEKSLTGEVVFGADGRASLMVDGEEYELLYPYIAAVDLEVESGDIVTVEGVIVPGPRWQEDEDVRYLRVSRAVINGEEHDLDAASYGYGMHGRRGGPGAMGARGGQSTYGPSMMGSRSHFGGPGARGPQASQRTFRGPAGKNPGMRRY